ncbi:unnamed protein product [Gadus morhua 'NCC']
MNRRQGKTSPERQGTAKTGENTGEESGNSEGRRNNRKKREDEEGNTCSKQAANQRHGRTNAGREDLREERGYHSLPRRLWLSLASTLRHPAEFAAIETHRNGHRLEEEDSNKDSRTTGPEVEVTSAGPQGAGLGAAAAGGALCNLCVLGR